MLRRHDQVNVIAHQAIRPPTYAGILALVAKQVQVHLPVTRLAKDILPIRTPLGHMIGISR